MSRIFATLGILFLFSCISAGSKIPGGILLVIIWFEYKPTDIICEGSNFYVFVRCKIWCRLEDPLKEPDLQIYVKKLAMMSIKAANGLVGNHINQTRS